MIEIQDLIVERIDNFYRLHCSKTLLEASGYGLQKVARDLNEKDKDRDQENALAVGQSYTATRSAVRFV